MHISLTAFRAIQRSPIRHFASISLLGFGIRVVLNFRVLAECVVQARFALMFKSQASTRLLHRLFPSVGILASGSVTIVMTWFRQHHAPSMLTSLLKATEHNQMRLVSASVVRSLHETEGCVSELRIDPSVFSTTELSNWNLCSSFLSVGFYEHTC
jgi:hypothetical protein